MSQPDVSKAPKWELLLIDVSNSFTKIAFASRTRLGRVRRVETARLGTRALRALPELAGVSRAVIASVVPEKRSLLAEAISVPICWVGPDVNLGIGLDYPNPRTIGADRLANAAAAASLYGIPVIAVDLGTAATFDVVSRSGRFVGGVIAPGLAALADYLSERTAQLPRVRPRLRRGAVGRSTREAIQSGTVHGFRGMVTEILRQIQAEQFAERPAPVVATGGDAGFLSGAPPIFTAINPRLTLEGLRLIGSLNSPASAAGRARRSRPRPGET